MKQFLDKIKPHNFFLVAAIVWGIFYFVFTPPLQAPDEHDHFRRVYHIASGHFLPEKKDNRLGGEMPVGFRQFFLPYRLTATNLKYTLNKTTVLNSFNEYYNAEETEFNDFPNTSYYSPVSYLPQAVGVFIFKQLNVSSGALFYAGRVFIFLTWLVSMYFFIRMLPAFKWLFTLLTLLPMQVFLSNSYSADVVTIILSYLFIGLILKHSFTAKKILWRDILLMTLLGIFLALSKVVYVGLVFSVFIIPVKKFSSRKHFFMACVIVTGISFLCAWLWSGVVMNYYTPYGEYNEAHKNFCCLSSCANYYKQKEYILTHGGYFLNVIYESIFRHPHNYLVGYIGSFGNNDNPMPVWLLWIAYGVILFTAIFEPVHHPLSLPKKFILFGAAFLSFVLLLLSQHLTWDCVGEGIVDLVQGRYMIPLFPLVFLFFTGFVQKIKIYVSLIVMPTVFFLNMYGGAKVYKRYFKESHIDETTFTCGAEETNEKGLFKTSDPNIFIEGGAYKNDSIARTGKSSLLLHKHAPYGFTYKTQRIHYGDLVEISAWQKGGAATYVLIGKGNNCDFYFPNTHIAYKDSGGWNRVHYAFTITTRCTPLDSVDAGFFIWNPDTEKVYVDDLRLRIKRYGNDYQGELTDRFK